MGIPFLYLHYYKKYKNENQLTINEHQLKIQNIESLFFDYNSLIHPCAQDVLQNLDENEKESCDIIEDKIIKKCISYTKTIINLVNPINVYIMIDGVAPMAKIKQQKERRYKSFYLSNKNVKWDTNNITPGTPFMEKLNEQLKTFKFCDYNIYISDSNEPGEGEHKMMKIINSQKCNGNVGIYGLDCDLVMLSMKSDKKIVLIRENKKDDTFTYVNIDVLKTSICKDIRDNVISYERLTDRQLIDDYIFLCFLLGNDFIEHIPSLSIKNNGANILNKMYRNLINNTNSGTLVNGDTINKEYLSNIFKHISKSEDYYFKNVYSYKKCHENIESEHVIVYDNDYIEYSSQNYKERYYLYYEIDDISNLCQEYYKGLVWTLSYYNGHSHSNWDYYNKYHCSPFASDLAKFNFKDFTFKKTQSLNPIQQLLLVLPRESFNSIYKNSILDKYKYMFPDKLLLDLSGKELLWQSKVFFEKSLSCNLEFINCVILDMLKNKKIE